MQERIERLSEERSKLTTAFSTITGERQKALDRLEEIKAEYPALIAAVALGEADRSALEEVRGEITRLQVIVNGPHLAAIEIIKKGLPKIDEESSLIRSRSASIQKERTYRKHFNRVLETRSMKADDWEFLNNEAAHHHRNDVAALDSVLRDFVTKDYHNLPGSPSIIDFAASQGVTPYNLNVTLENIQDPRRA